VKLYEVKILKDIQQVVSTYRKIIRNSKNAKIRIEKNPYEIIITPWKYPKDFKEEDFWKVILRKNRGEFK